MKVSTAIDFCLQYHKINSRPNTIKNYEFLLGKFGEFCHDREVESITTEDIKVRDGELWWHNRRWRNVFFHDANKGFQWETDALLDYDTRATRPWFSATYFPSKVADKPPTMYIATLRDDKGDIMKAGETYSLTVPKDVPIKQFWSLTIYDQATWAFIYSPEMRPGLSSRDKLKKNDNGSVTLYFGPKAPKGLESNWIPTAGKAPYAMFRFYGPTDAFYDKSFVLSDIELVK